MCGMDGENFRSMRKMLPWKNECRWVYARTLVMMA